MKATLALVLMDANPSKKKHITELLRRPRFILHVGLMVVLNFQIKTDLTKLSRSILGDLLVMYIQCETVIVGVVVVVLLEDAWIEIEW